MPIKGMSRGGKTNRCIKRNTKKKLILQGANMGLSPHTPSRKTTNSNQTKEPFEMQKYIVRTREREGAEWKQHYGLTSRNCKLWAEDHGTRQKGEIIYMLNETTSELLSGIYWNHNSQSYSRIQGKDLLRIREEWRNRNSQLKLEI